MAGRLPTRRQARSEASAQAIMEQPMPRLPSTSREKVASKAVVLLLTMQSPEKATATQATQKPTAIKPPPPACVSPCFVAVMSPASPCSLFPCLVGNYRTGMGGSEMVTAKNKVSTWVGTRYAAPQAPR